MTTLTVERFEFGSRWTIGKLYIDGVYECFTLERELVGFPDRKPCIPAGTYQVVIDYSNRFETDMPHILDVQGYQGIRIHQGNTDKDTEGCILLGQTWVGNDFVGQSHLAFESFFPKLQGLLAQGLPVQLVVQESTAPQA